MSAVGVVGVDAGELVEVFVGEGVVLGAEGDGEDLLKEGGVVGFVLFGELEGGDLLRVMAVGAVDGGEGEGEGFVGGGGIGDAVAEGSGAEFGVVAVELEEEEARALGRGRRGGYGAADRRGR